MHRFKPLLLLLLILLSGFNVQVSKPYLTKWVITKGCSLRVGGSTNVNKFVCVIADYYRPDTLTFYRGNNTEAVRVTGALKLDVENFDCHNPVMTSDLRKTLKAKQFPKLTVKFINLSRYPDRNQDAVKGMVAIELAGVTRQFEVDYKFMPNQSNARLVGTRNVNFSDFNITPPRKLGGMIQTENELSVEFNLNVRVLE